MFVYCDAECKKPTEVSGLTPHFQPRCVDQWHHGTEDHCDGQKGLGVKWHVHAGPWWLGGQRGANNEETTESDGQVIKNTEYVIHCYIYDHIMNHTYICIWFIYDCIYNRIYIYILICIHIEMICCITLWKLLLKPGGITILSSGLLLGYLPGKGSKRKLVTHKEIHVYI